MRLSHSLLPCDIGRDFGWWAKQRPWRARPGDSPRPRPPRLAWYQQGYEQATPASGPPAQKWPELAEEGVRATGRQHGGKKMVLAAGLLRGEEAKKSPLCPDKDRTSNLQSSHADKSSPKRPLPPWRPSVLAAFSLIV